MAVTVNGPLDGIRVVDLSAVVSGPLATAILADQGADVITVEAVDAPDLIRFAGVVAEGTQGVSAFWASQNRNKRAIALNLKDDRGLAVFRRLVERADVVVQNFRPGVVDRMGLGWAALHELNPNLVMASISGFGSTGPLQHRPAFDPIIQSFCGYPVIQADADGRPRLMKTILDRQGHVPQRGPGGVRRAGRPGQRPRRPARGGGDGRRRHPLPVDRRHVEPHLPRPRIERCPT